MIEFRLFRFLRFVSLCFFSSILILFQLATNANSAQVTLAWDPNTEPDVAGYRIYYGLLSDQYSNSVDVGNHTSCTLSNLQDGKTYYLAATAYDRKGYESDFSNEVVFNAPPVCTYSVSPVSQSFGSGGGTGTVNIITTSGCKWTAASNASWLIITSNGSGTGNGAVNYSVLSNSSTSQRTGTLTVAGQTFTVTQSGAVPPTITTSSPLPSKVLGVAYSQTLQATGGTTPYSWSITSGSLPPGLSLNSSTGLISGTPTTANTYNFRARVTGSNTLYSEKDFSLTINPAPTPPTITTSSPLPSKALGVAYSQTLQATGGTTPYSWSITSGSLPPGLILNSSTGVISGTPTVANTFNFRIRVTGSNALYSEKDFSLIINPAPTPPTITTSSPLPSKALGVAYSQTLQATGGTTPYSWSITSGSLPPGLSLNSSTGLISGTPTTANTYTFRARVTGSNALYSEKDFSLTINPAPTPPTITTSSPLPSKALGVAYSQTLQATGGTTPYSWSITSGSLPPGLILNSSTGVISGTPTTANTYNFRARVTGSNALYSEKDFSLTINPAPTPPTITTNTPLPSATVGAAYSQTLQATGGTTPYSWSITSGSLPTGLSLNSSTGVISGTPTVANTFNFRIRVTGSNALYSEKDFSLTINPAPGHSG